MGEYKRRQEVRPPQFRFFILTEKFPYSTHVGAITIVKFPGKLVNSKLPPFFS
jgi:hypothetical protein